MQPNLSLRYIKLVQILTSVAFSIQVKFFIGMTCKFICVAKTMKTERLLRKYTIHTQCCFQGLTDMKFGGPMLIPICGSKINSKHFNIHFRYDLLNNGPPSVGQIMPLHQVKSLVGAFFPDIKNSFKDVQKLKNNFIPLWVLKLV